MESGDKRTSSLYFVLLAVVDGDGFVMLRMVRRIRIEGATWTIKRMLAAGLKLIGLQSEYSLASLPPSQGRLENDCVSNIPKFEMINNKSSRERDRTSLLPCLHGFWFRDHSIAIAANCGVFSLSVVVICFLAP